jgi:hypothetical protein
MTRPTCRRCGDRLAVDLAGTGVHVLCCDPACDAWPCDGSQHPAGPGEPGQPGEQVTVSFSGFLPARPKVSTSGGWCVSCGCPVDVPGGVCSPICLSRLARKRSPAAYEPRLERP